MRRHRITRYTVKTPAVSSPLLLALVTDLHNGGYQDVVDTLAGCDAILVCGDLVDRHKQTHETASAFLRDAPRLAPTFFSIGNHERRYEGREGFFRELDASGVTVLDNRAVRFGELSIGGLSSVPPPRDPDTRVMEELSAMPGFRLLMCHHPEYFARSISRYPIHLTVSGHAHGGQVALFGQGLFAPGQGFLPRYTHGLYEQSRLLVSRGMTNSAGVPRIGVPRELVLVRLENDRA
ncbi:MAG: metallophosphoesterase [bacterium]|nr:metallophosphoesterase [bacterium]